MRGERSERREEVRGERGSERREEVRGGEIRKEEGAKEMS